jgi:rubredoxin
MSEASDFHLYRCGACGFSYSERAGLDEDGIAPGTRWADVPESWTCPDCGALKSEFTESEGTK